MARGRKAGIKISWDAVEKLVQTKTYEKDSAADAKYPHKAGETYERVVISDMRELNEVFSGDVNSALVLLSAAVTARREARKADPDATLISAVKKLFKSNFFVGFGVTPADSDDPTNAEIQAALAILKSMKK